MLSIVLTADKWKPNCFIFFTQIVGFTNLKVLSVYLFVTWSYELPILSLMAFLHGFSFMLTIFFPTISVKCLV
jgi:hypothetical protein